MCIAFKFYAFDTKFFKQINIKWMFYESIFYFQSEEKL